MNNDKDKKPQAEDKGAETAAAKKKIPLFVPIIAVVLSVLLIAAAIIIPFVLNGQYVTKYQNPVAVIELSDGRKIEMEIWEEDCPIAATNFISLARAKYFDGTVFYDASHGFVRFGGWKTDATHRGDSDITYKNTITDRPDYTKNKFGYRLYQDKADKADGIDARGIVSFGYERSATEFQIAIASGDSVDTELDGYDSWGASAFGAIINSDDIDYLKDIYDLSKSTSYIPNTKYTSDFYSGLTFFAPIDENGYITIKTVTVTKLLKSKWKDFSFVDFFNNKSADGTSSSKNGTWYNSEKRCGST